MIKRFNTSAHPVLSSVVDTMEASLECPKFRQLTNRIEMCTTESVKFSRSENRRVAEAGFGTCLLKSYGYDIWDAAIVVSMDNCSKAGLTEREITAVVYHELGHILNEPELRTEPTFEFCFMYQIPFDPDVLDDIRKANCMDMEFFADSYANKHGYGAELVSTFDKQNEYFEQKIGYYPERIEKILNNEYLEGSIMRTRESRPAF